MKTHVEDHEFVPRAAPQFLDLRHYQPHQPRAQQAVDLILENYQPAQPRIGQLWLRTFDPQESKFHAENDHLLG